MSRFEIKILKELEELQEFREVWQRFSITKNTDFDYYRTIIKNRDDVIGPFVMIIFKNDEVKMILIGRREYQCIEYKVGYLKFRSKKVKMINILYGGFIGEFSAEIFQIANLNLRKSLEKKVADIIKIMPIKKDVVNLLLLNEPRKFIDYIVKKEPDSHYCINLPNNYEIFEKQLSSKHRYSMRRSLKLLKNESENSLKFECFSQIDNNMKVLKDLEYIAEKTYHRKLGFGFNYKDNKNEINQRFMLESEKGWLKVFLVYKNTEPIAFWNFSLYKEIAYANETGFIPEYGKYSIGTILLLEAIKTLCNENVKMIDFGMGNAEYKKRFSNYNWQEQAIIIFAKNMKCSYYYFLYKVIESINKILKLVLVKTSLLSKIKKRWRYS